MKKKPQHFFLPMTQAAVDSIARHLDIPLAKQIFGLLAFREKHTLAKGIPRTFADLVDAERNYRFHLNRMRAEIEQIYNITPRIVQVQVTEQLLEIVEMLEKLIKAKRVIKELKDSNQNALIHFPSEDGKLKTLKTKRKKSEQLDEKLLSSPFFDDYLLLLRSMLDYFKMAMAPFVSYSLQSIAEDYELPSDLGLYADDDLRKYISKWPAFIKICEDFSEPRKYEWIKRGKEKEALNYRVIEKLEGEEMYKWVGIPKAKIASLTDFLQMLMTKEIFPSSHLSNQGRAVFKFFNIEDRKDVGFVIDDLFAAERTALYKSCFDGNIAL